MAYTSGNLETDEGMPAATEGILPSPPALAGHDYGRGSLVSKLVSNLQYKGLFMEASGALGDLGTFVPITVALTLVNGLDLGTTLIFTGLYNIITGLLFGIPMPVQPMKSIAAVALTHDHLLSLPQIMAAGLSTSAVLFFLGITRLMGLVQRLIPLPVVRGIQLSQGLSFAITAVKYVTKKQDFALNKSLGQRQWLGLDGLLIALLCFCFIVVVTGSGDHLIMRHARKSANMHCSQPEEKEEEELDAGDGRLSSSGFRRRLEWIPTAMVVFLLGIVLTFIGRPDTVGQLRVGPSKPHVMHISKQDWRIGFVRAAVPQIPVSVLNSVIAVCKLSNDLYPDKKTQVTPTSVSTSVGLMNLVGCWFGAMPVCHGAGGLAGQWRFGARSGAAVVMLGVGKILLGLLLGSSLVKILAGYPVGILGVLLLYAGMELAMTVRDMTRRGESFVVLVATAISISASDAALGFLVALAVHMLLALPDLSPAQIRCFITSNLQFKYWTKPLPPPPTPIRLNAPV